MADEILETPAEVPAPPVQAEDQNPESVPPAPQSAPPPAAELVLNGEVKNERELQLERELEAERERAKKAETIAAEWQDKATTLMQPPTPEKKPARPKRKHNWLMPVIGAEDENE